MKVYILIPLLALQTSLLAQFPTNKKPGKTSRSTGFEYATYESYIFSLDEFKGPEDNIFFSSTKNAKYAPYPGIKIGSNLYVDQTEVSNIDYLEFLALIQYDSTSEFYSSMLLDSTVWEKSDKLPREFVTKYLRDPAYRYFPVVGITPQQAANYCQWKSMIYNVNISSKNGKEETIEYTRGRLPTLKEWRRMENNGGRC